MYLCIVAFAGRRHNLKLPVILLWRLTRWSKRQAIDSVEHVTSKPRWVRSTLVGTLKILWMLSKKTDTSRIASGLRAAGEGVDVDIEAVALSVSVTLSVVGLLDAVINSLDDTRDTAS